MYICIYIYIYTYMHIHTYLYTCIHVYTYTYMHIYTYAYIQCIKGAHELELLERYRQSELARGDNMEWEQAFAMTR